MKNKISFFIVPALLFTVLLLFSCENSTEKTEVYYLQSYNLSETQIEIVENLVCKKINQITQEDLNGVTQITVAGKNVSPSSSVISEQSVSDYKFSGKTYKYDESYGNELSILGIFEALKDLTIFYEPFLTDASFLSNLINLTSINITMTNIRDFTCLEMLGKLKFVTIFNSPAEKINFNQYNTIKEFLMTASLISDASVFDMLNENINRINISHNKVSIANLDVLQKFTELKHLTIGAPELDFSFLSGFNADIESLSIGGSKNIDLNYILVFKETLTDLEIFDTDDIDLTPIDELENIKKVSLFNVKNPVRGAKTQPESNTLYFDINFNLNFFGWFEYEE